MFELIGCPMHYGVSDDGLKQAIAALNERFPDLGIREIPEVDCAEDGLPNLKNLNSVIATCEAIAAEEDRVIRAGKTPLFIGGDHAAAMGSIAGAAANCEKLGLLWIDAHADINTDITSITGNIHGMPVSAVMGFGNERLCSIFGDHFDSLELAKVKPQHAVLFGVRDLDPLEVEIVDRLGVRSYSYTEVMERGIEVCLREAMKYLCGTSRLHVSFDLDSMDPDIIKGVTVPVKSGFHEDDVLRMFGWLQGHCNLSSVDIVEYNPVYDTDGRTGEFVNTLIEKITKA